MNPIDHPHGGGEGRTSVVVTRSRRGCSHSGSQDPQQQAHDKFIVRRNKVARGLQLCLGVPKGPFVDDHP